MIDLQPQVLFGVGNFDRQDTINKNVEIAKAAMRTSMRDGIGLQGGLVSDGRPRARHWTQVLLRP